MDAFELLKKDHQKVSQLFSKIESASGQAKLQLFGQLKAELDLHAHIEEKVLYPALENTDEAREITLEAYEEHKVVKDLLAEIDNDGAPDEEWDAKLKVLKENVEHHVEEEEGELFSKARKALGQPRIDELGLELETEKTRAAVGETATPEPAKEAEENSPGVLQRLANLVGLGGDTSYASDSTAKKRSTRTKKPSAPTSKPRSATTKKTAAKTAGKKSPVSARSTKSKSAPKAAAKKATKSGTKGGTKAKASRATKSASKKSATGSRTAASKRAPRAASNQKVKAAKSKQARKSTRTRAKSR